MRCVLVIPAVMPRLVRWGGCPGTILGVLFFLLWAVPVFAQTVIETFTIPGTYTWTAPATVTSVTVQAWGGGGAGGGVSGASEARSGGGGAGGQYAQSVLSVTPGTTYALNVGHGGVASTGDGGTGGHSSFASLMMARGGNGGASDGAPGSGSASGGLGDVVFAGGGGSSGPPGHSGAGGGGAGSGGKGDDASGLNGGRGTAAGGGNGGDGRTSVGDGYAGYAFGGGGGGAFSRSDFRRGGAGGPGCVVVTYELSPYVESISIASPNPTSAGNDVSWTVVFSESVTGVDLSDFALTAGGAVAGASLTSITGSNTTWVVSAYTGTGETGTLRLDLRDDDSITSSTGDVLGGPGSGNGDFSGGVYTLAVPAPILTKEVSSTAATLGDVVTFTIKVTGSRSETFHNVSVTDTLPMGMSYLTHVVSTGSVDVSGQHVTWTIPTLAFGQSEQLTLAVSLSQQGSLTNTVTAPGSVSASATVLVLASAVTHFRMDEPVGSWSGAEGEVIDSGGTSLHGRRLTSSAPTATNVVDPDPTIASQHSSVVGGFCNSAEFDGRAIVEVGESPLFDYTTQFSASVWIYPTAYPNSDLYSILSNDTNYEFHLNPAGKLYWWWQASTLTSATTIPLNQWTHIAITFDSSAAGRRQRMYINGVLDPNTNNWQGTLNANNCNFYVGGDIFTGAACRIASGRNFRGKIDEVKLYSFELSQDEVLADMRLGRSCSGNFDHIRIEHDGVASICTPERVTIKACMDPSCTSLYPGIVTIHLSPDGWIDGNTFTFSGGIASRFLARSSAGTVSLGTTSVSPAPSSATRCYDDGARGCALEFEEASCAFDAVEVGALPQTAIFTKLAGVPFAVDLLALLDATTVNSTFSGAVQVDLVDAREAACPSGAGLGSAANIAFVAGDAGRKTVTLSLDQAAPNVRVRTVMAGSAPACSSDNFAIRPRSMTVSSSDAGNFSLPGTGTVIAGDAFHLTATALRGYDGTPVIDPTRVVGSPVAGTLSGAFSGAVPATGNATGADFRYSEVGHFGLARYAVYDESFTAVDQPNDCLSGFSNTLSAGKYGCSFGSDEVPLVLGSSGFGRFVPARFNVSGNTPSFADSCSDFTYLDQPFDYQIDPEITITALNRYGDVTLNYGGSYWRLQTSLAGRTYADSAGTGSPLSVAVGGAVSWSGTADNDGVGLARLVGESLVYGKGTAAQAPFVTDVDLTLSAADLTDSDGICFDPASDGTCSSLTFSSIGDTEQLFGELHLQNAYGPETVPLIIPIYVDYYDGSSFVLNDRDSCTGLDVSYFALSDYQGNLSAGDTSLPSAPFTTTLVAGRDESFTLSAPGTGHDGRVSLVYDLDLAGAAWLKNGADNPLATARFGIYRGNTHLIYMRESLW